MIFVHAQDDLNLRILEGTFSLDAVHIKEDIILKKINYQKRDNQAI